MEFKFGKKVTPEFINEKLTIDPKLQINTAKRLAKLSRIRQRECYLCGSTKSRIVSKFFGINYLKCQNCSHVYTNKRLSGEELSKFYSKNKKYFQQVYTNTKILKLRVKIFAPKIDYIKKFSKGKSWLDVGSGDGTAVYVARKKGFQATGIEISETARNFAKKYRNLKLHGEPLDEFVKTIPKKWDVISFFGVIEHLPQPMAVLKLSNYALKKNGLVVLEVPNYNSLSTKVQDLSKLVDRHLVPYAHIMMFTQRSANYALIKTGFKPIATWFWGQDFLEVVKYLNTIDGNFKNSGLKLALIEKLNQLQEVFDKDKRSDEFMIIGKKFKHL